MKVLHCCSRYFPDRGGSETYVSSLLRALKAPEVHNYVASSGGPRQTSEYEGVAVHRLGPADTSNAGYVSQLREFVAETKPDVIHFHWQPPGVTEFLAGPRKPQCPLVLTYHHPSFTCSRGDLQRFGAHPCSGVFSRNFCLPCLAHERGAPRALASLLPLMPDSVSDALAHRMPPGRLKTAVGLGPSLTSRIANTHQFLGVLQKVMVLSEWSRRMLIANGVEGHRVQLSRLGTHHSNPVTAGIRRPKTPGETIRGIFVGRLDAVKGVDILAQGMQAVAGEPVAVDVYGPLEGADPRLAPFIEAGKKPGAKLRFPGLLRDAGVVDTMQGYDFAIVCSQFLETGPYTVIEAFQAGLPVLGTDIGGINEMVSHNFNGWLVPAKSVQKWAEVLGMIAGNPSVLETWRRNVSWNRTMDDVAGEVAQTYRTVIDEFARDSMDPALQAT